MFSMKHLLALSSDRRRLERELELGVYYFAALGDLATTAELWVSRRGKVWS